MLSFLNLLKERKLQSGTLLIILCALLLTLLQGYTLYEICSNTHKESKETLYNALLAKTTQLNTTVSQTAPFAVFSYRPDDHSVKILKTKIIDSTIVLNEKMDIPLLRCKGTYDARDTNLWNLDTLGGLLKSTFKNQRFTPPFTLHLTDKDETRLATYRYKMLSLPIWTYRFEIPLGFLEHHQLSAKFVYPISHLWSEVWDKAITTLVLSFLLYRSIASLSKQLKREKEISEFRKVSAQRMVHDLRSPMLYIKQILPVLIGGEAAAQKEKIDRCQKKIVSMLDNTNILLSESMNAYKLEAHQELSDVDAIIKKVVEEHQNSYDDKHISITINSQLSEKMNVDPIQIQATLGNLVENAIKYSGPAPCIDIRSWVENDCLLISVKDNGIGIPKSEQKNIFLKEHRVKPKENSIQPKGYGIGLHYVASVAQAHKGKISVESDGKSGSTFTLEIPQKNKK